MFWSTLSFACYFLLVFLKNCDAQGLEAYLCNQRSFKNGTGLETNLNKVMKGLVDGASAAGFDISVYGQTQNDTVYGMVACRGDSSPKQWRRWVSGATISLRRECGNAIGGRIWFGYCYLRWDTYNFTGILDEFGWYQINSTDVDMPADYSTAAQELLGKLITDVTAAPGPTRRYALGSIPVAETSFRVYGLVQCWDDISVNGCGVCLNNVQNLLIDNSYGSEGGVMLTGSCFIMFRSRLFYMAPPPPPPKPVPPSSTPAAPKHRGPQVGHRRMSAIISAAAIVCAVLLLLLVSVIIRIRRRRQMYLLRDGSSQRKDLGPFDANEETQRGKSQQIIFTLKMLAEATNNFADNCKLGKGGFGSVYKGTLPDGRVIAVKKLSTESVKGEWDFMNEVRLLSEIHHKNLVRLLGCCVEGKERMLICEFMANNSLDKVLFDRIRRQRLDWPRRYNIICGIAQGLSYLHEDSRVRIIHRDIKAANVLLDEKLNPKIADFGLAKFCPDDKSSTGSRIIGTLGYMAPEYVMHGKLSAKVDIYSFGVVILEIISGRRNTKRGDPVGVPSLVEKTWKLYEEGHEWEVVDEIIKLRCNQEEVIRLIHVALLCTQGNPQLRPSTTEVVIMLTSKSFSLPSPCDPPRALFTQTSITSRDNNRTRNPTSNSNVTSSEKQLECGNIAHKKPHSNVRSQFSSSNNKTTKISSFTISLSTLNTNDASAAFHTS